MKTQTLILLFVLHISLSLSGQSSEDDNWSQWRGPFETGVAPDSDPPVEWSETKNIKWKTSIPGTGHSTPIIWEDNIILLSAVPTDKKVGAESEEEEEEGWMKATTTDLIHEFTVICVNRRNGKIKWQTVVRE